MRHYRLPLREAGKRGRSMFVCEVLSEDRLAMRMDIGLWRRVRIMRSLILKSRRSFAGESLPTSRISFSCASCAAMFQSPSAIRHLPIAEPQSWVPARRRHGKLPVAAGAKLALQRLMNACAQLEARFRILLADPRSCTCTGNCRWRRHG